MLNIQTEEDPIIELIDLALNTENWSFSLKLSAWIVGAIILFGAIYLIYKMATNQFGWHSFELDEAEFGVGNQKLKFKPSVSDKQLAYEVWVELSTRKIGLPIDYEHDVITEIYDSWYSFFSITRELIKTVKVTKIKKQSTQTIINLSIDILNEGLRPHLTKWQSRFRYWFDAKLKRIKPENFKEHSSLQDIQKSYPQYELLKEDMERVNKQLIAYRNAMRKLAFSE